jgi:hypothetical protein
MQPYYFPFVRNNGEYLEGFFDYRPRNEQEATVAAISFDWGKRWIFDGETLGLNPYCPADQTDPDNNNVIVDGLSTPYASDPNNAADNGLGHAFVMTVDGVQLLYQLNRPELSPPGRQRNNSCRACRNSESADYRAWGSAPTAISTLIRSSYTR